MKPLIFGFPVIKSQKVGFTLLNTTPKTDMWGLIGKKTLNK